MKRLLIVFSLLVLPLLIPAVPDHFAQAAQTSLNREEQIKAAMLLKIRLFITWPDMEQRRDDTVRLCLRSTTRFHDFLEKLITLENQQTSSRPVSLTRLSQDTPAASLAQCDMLFQSQPPLPASRDFPRLLVITENIDSNRTHAHITLFRKDNAVRFDVNLNNLRKSQLVMSAHLLKLAETVVQ